MMKMNRVGHFDSVLSWTVLAFIFILLPVFTGCNELEGWRDSQIKLSNSLAADAGKLVAPDPPIKIPSKITKQLPWMPEFVALTFTEGRGDVTITALSPQDTLQTAKWMFSKLAQLGYDSEDNPSRMLEGVEYMKGKGMYGKLYVKVTMNVHDQCTVELRAYEVDEKGRPSR